MELFLPECAELPLIWHRNRAISRTEFAAAARGVAQHLASLPATHFINLCTSRLAFMAGAVAVMLLKRQTVLPANQSDAALAHLRTQYPAHAVLDDSLLEQVSWQSGSGEAINFDDAIPFATLFTSGSTGTPQAHHKTWGELWRTGSLDAARFTSTEVVNLVATVPSQHMFGLQTTVLLPLRSHCAIHDSRPFFPADIRSALESLPGTRALITTPTHLRACIEAELTLPPLDFILSATAPMPATLAVQAESRWRTRVLEIYGSTEAGTIATRRSISDPHWQLIEGSSMLGTSDGTLFKASHLPEPLLLTDHVQMQDEQTFMLLGRSTDQIKVAGKRASLNELTQILLSIDGVRDGVIFMPEQADRTAALVVSSLSNNQLLDQLRARMDAVFLPRPLVQLATLPRNEVGKLTRAALEQALTERGKT